MCVILGTKVRTSHIIAKERFLVYVSNHYSADYNDFVTSFHGCFHEVTNVNIFIIEHLSFRENSVAFMFDEEITQPFQKFYLSTGTCIKLINILFKIKSVTNKTHLQNCLY